MEGKEEFLECMEWSGQGSTGEIFKDLSLSQANEKDVKGFSGLHGWWSSPIEDGPAYSYHVNASKTWLITKSDLLSKAKEMFQDTGIHITEDGQQHLGAALGASTFIDTCKKRR